MCLSFSIHRHCHCLHTHTHVPHITLASTYVIAPCPLFTSIVMQNTLFSFKHSHCLINNICHPGGKLSAVLPLLNKNASINCSLLRSWAIASLLNSCVKCVNSLVILSSRTVFYVNYFCNVCLKISSLSLLQPQALCPWKSCPYLLTEYWKLLPLHRLLLPFPITCHRQQCQNITSKSPIYKAKSTSYPPNFRLSQLNLIHAIRLASVVAVHLAPVFLGHHFPVHPVNLACLHIVGIMNVLVLLPLNAIHPALSSLHPSLQPLTLDDHNSRKTSPPATSGDKSSWLLHYQSPVLCH